MRAPRLIVGVVAYVALFAVLLFVPAGTVEWRRAWVLLGVLLVARTATVWSVARVNPELMVERTALPIHRGQPVDRVLVSLFMASFAALVAFCAADVWRLHLLPAPPVVLSAAGLAAFAFGWWICARVLLTNAFATTVVRHQEERAHRVVDTGVYAVVRHPMYAAQIPLLAGMGLWLGSTAGALAAAVPMAILAVRIVFEERFLRGHLDGYADYTRRVRWRLVPGLW
jgi:protein-S-isoprenylcysteine O-methyltransferase Ste14